MRRVALSTTAGEPQRTVQIAVKWITGPRLSFHGVQDYGSYRAFELRRRDWSP
jgi:hypothetical protein